MICNRSSEIGNANVLCLFPCLNTFGPEPYIVPLPIPAFLCYSWNDWVFLVPTDPNSMEHSEFHILHGQLHGYTYVSLAS